MTMAPATEAVMASLPRTKAGVGSAINDTTRQVGGALGVAVIGTIVSSVYSARIVDLGGVFGLAPDQLAQAESSLGGAQSLAVGLGDQADAFAAAAGDGFVDALSIGLRIAAFAVAGAFVVAWKFLPSHAAEPEFEVIDRSEQFDAEMQSGPQPAPTPVAGN